MKLLHVDSEKCTRCSICAQVCPASFIKMTEEGPQENEFRFCISCGHCVAACPHGALDNERTPLAEQEPIKLSNWDEKTARDFLRSRRSIRRYKKEPVAKEKLLQLLDIARFAPTGGNGQGLSYVVISDKEKLQQITELTIQWMEQELSNGAPSAAYYRNVVRQYRTTGEDMILRGAPHLIVALCDKEFPRGQENAHFSFSYAELYAPTIGLGTCWAGYFQACAFTGYAPLLAVLEIPEDKKVAGALMAGYSQYRYYRMVERNPLAVTWL